MNLPEYAAVTEEVVKVRNGGHGSLNLCVRQVTRLPQLILTHGRFQMRRMSMSE